MRKSILASFVLCTLTALPLTAAEADLSGLPPVAQSAETAHPIGVGTVVPTGPLLDIDGHPFDLSASIRATPSVLIFYRGGWCPYCNLQMDQLIALEPRLKTLGYQILAISPDKPESLRESLHKHPINYTLLSDSPMIVSRKFGLAWDMGKMNGLIMKVLGKDLIKASGQSHYWLPVPAAYVVDKNGRITYSFYDPDFTKRVDPNQLYQAAQAALSSAH